MKENNEEGDAYIQIYCTHERAEVHKHAQTLIQTSIEPMCLNVLMLEIRMKHTQYLWVHIIGLLLRSWPFCDIWKGQEEHHSLSHTDTHIFDLHTIRCQHGPPIPQLNTQISISNLD